MKRIMSACLEQTQCFEGENDCQTYLRMLQRKHIKYQLLDKQLNEKGGIVIHIKREYNGYPIGNYFEPDR